MKKLIAVGLFLNAAILTVIALNVMKIAQGGTGVAGGGLPCATLNGDVNGDGGRDVSDPVFMLNWLFGGGPTPVELCEAQGGGLTPEQAEILSHMSIVELPMGVDEEGNDLGTAKTIRFTGVNVQVVNGLGATNGNPDDFDTFEETEVNGVGNLIVGYNENRDPRRLRTGSHNVVVGIRNSYTSFGGFVAGSLNTVSGPVCSVSGGFLNTASGVGNTSVSGGRENTTSGFASSVSGGVRNIASGDFSSVSGGRGNTTSGFASSVSGGGGGEKGEGNEAEADYSTVSGGRGIIATEEAQHLP